MAKPAPNPNELLLKGIVLALVGMAVLISPGFIRSPGFQAAVGGSAPVGWFALVLGVAFIAQWALRRRKGR